MSDQQRPLIDIPEGKAGAHAIVRLLLETAACADAWALPTIDRWETNFQLVAGRVDFLVMHSDGSVTAVVVTGDESRRAVLTTLGPLIAIGAELRALFECPVRLLIAAPVPGRSVSMAMLQQLCELVGVAFEPLGPLAEHRSRLASLKAVEP